MRPLAADRMATGHVAIAAVAPSVGYESQSAFGAAFECSCSHNPRQFAKASAPGGAWHVCMVMLV